MIFMIFLCAGQRNMARVKHTSKDACIQTNKPELEIIHKT